MSERDATPMCDEVREAAAGLAALDRSDPQRVAAFTHAQVCAACAAELRQGEALVALLDGVPAPASPSADVLRRASAEILADLDRAAPAQAPVVPARAPTRTPGRRWLESVPTAAIALMWGAQVLFARHRVPERAAWIQSAVGGLLAVVSGVGAIGASRGRRIAGIVVGAVVALSAAFTLLAGVGDVLAPAVGVRCLLSELLAASLPVAATALLVARGSIAGGTGRFAAIAAAGALGGHAALHMHCPLRTEAPHLWAFHTGGVIVAALIGAAISRLPALRRVDPRG
jgi:hypothetical protein